LTQFGLIDDKGDLLWECGGNRDNYSCWKESTIPEGETVVGFRVITIGSCAAIVGLGLVTANNF